MLERRKAQITTTRLSKSEALSDSEADDLLASVDEVIVARGRSVRILVAKEATRDDLRGPTGGFRAPMVKSGRLLLVGFHEESLRRILS